MLPLNRLREYTEYGSIGIAWVAGTLVYVLVFRWAGQWLDQRLGTEPIFFVIGLLTAIGLSFWWLIERLMRIERDRKTKRQNAESPTNAQDREKENNPRRRRE